MTTLNTAQENFRQSEIRQQNAEHEWRQSHFNRNEFDREDDRAVVAQQRREAMYGLTGPVRFGAPSKSVTAAQQWALEAGFGPRTEKSAKALSDYKDWVVSNTDLRMYFQPREAGGGRGFVNPPMAFSQPAGLDINEGDPTPLRLRSAAEFRDLGRSAWNGLVGLADFGLMMGRGALQLYDKNLKSVTAPISDGLRLDYESDSYRNGGLGFFGETLTQTVAPSGLARLPGAVRGLAGEIRGLGVPDWNIQPGSPYQLNSIGGGFEFERIGGACGAASRLVPRVDVSDGFQLTRYDSGAVDLDYLNPDAGHGLLVSVDRNGTLGAEIRAQGGIAKLGSGRDMFISAMQRLEREGVQVNQIRGYWIDGTDSVNAAQFRAGVDSGLSPEAAALNTWTGRIASDHGFSKVKLIQPGRFETIVTFGR